MFHDVIACSGRCGKIRDGGAKEEWICEECESGYPTHHDYNPNGYHAGVPLCMCGCRGTIYECKKENGQ